MLKRKLSNIVQIEDQCISMNLVRTKCSKKVDNSVDSFQNVSPCWILRLPSEILDHIFSYLCPRSLLTMKELNCERFSDVTLNQKVADFTTCNDILPQEISLFFTGSRVQCIKEINFNHLFLINSSDLEKVIVKCKRLSSLSVVECGLSLQNISKILTCCKDLKELFWNVNNGSHTKLSDLDKSPLQIKKMHLYLHTTKDIHQNIFGVAFHLLKRCQLASEIFFSFASSRSPIFPITFSESTITYKLPSNFTCPLHVVFDFLNCSQSMLFVKHFCTNSDCLLSFAMHSFLQLVTTEEDFSLMTPINDKSVQSLILCCSDNTFLMSHIEAIKQITGKNLKYLALKEMILPILPSGALNISANLSMCGFLSKLTADCHYIKDLILSDVHFEDVFDFKILHNIKELNTLCLSACAFHSGSSAPMHYNQKTSLTQRNFEDLVKNCKDVQHFSIKGCIICSCGPKERDITSISEWSKLRTISLSTIKTFQFCYFLKNVSDGCPHLRSVEILDIGPSELCHYIPSVIYMLTNSPQLIFLSCNLDSLCARSNRFWDAVGLAKNLQGLCLLTKYYIEMPRLIIDAVKKLQFLHLFHLNDIRFTDNLTPKITRVMKSHGVKYPKVIISDQYGRCSMSHFYIP